MQKTPETIRLIRFEDKDGRGPYNPLIGKAMTWKLDQPVYSMEDHPTIEDELCSSQYEMEGRMDADHRNVRFAFTSARQRNRWFNARSRQQLREMGARCVVYEAPAEAVIASERQCIFDITRARRISW